MIFKEKDFAKSIYIYYQIVYVKIPFKNKQKKSAPIKNHGQSIAKSIALGNNHFLSLLLFFFYVAFPLHNCIIIKKDNLFKMCNINIEFFFTWGIWFMSNDHAFLNIFNFNQTAGDSTQIVNNFVTPQIMLVHRSLKFNKNQHRIFKLYFQDLLHNERSVTAEGQQGHHNRYKGLLKVVSAT